ncbi:MAG: phosphate signaling complex protein PhoU [Methanoregula sp.]|nr:phosphate signaling complex protein PhoU [Methanoregula sp.]MDD5188481.1 phosphate signaling complex protein PhoU [Methanoregula sp.]
MTEKFHAELNSLKDETIGMAQCAREMLDDSVKALVAQDCVLAQSVVAKKKRIRDQTINLEERAYMLIALNQPMAKDMRVIACILKMITAAERIGRYGKDIANMIERLKDEPDFAEPLPVLHMAELVTAMIDDAITAFKRENLDPIREFSTRDDTVDTLWHSIFRETLTFMMENPTTITRSTYFIMVARYLERSGDHACKMAENIYYMITGERMEIK